MRRVLPKVTNPQLDRMSQFFDAAESVNGCGSFHATCFWEREDGSDKSEWTTRRREEISSAKKD